MKSFRVLFVTFLFVLGSVVQSFAAVQILVDSQPISMDVPPVLQNGRTLVPVAAIAGALGAEVRWDSSTKTVTILKDGQIITLQLGNTLATVNGASSVLDVPAQAVNGRTMVPLSFIATAFGSQVLWDNATKTVSIHSQSQLNPALAAPTESTSLSAANLPASLPAQEPLPTSPPPDSPATVSSGNDFEDLDKLWVDDQGNGLIKGNVNSRNTGSPKRIYHLPGMNSYDRTIIDTGKGERWFKTQREALDAGWIPAEK